jgi:hypothetical protein
MPDEPPARRWLCVVWSGRYRFVLVVGPIAVKIPKLGRWNEGRACSRREANRSRLYDRYCRVRQCWGNGVVLVLDRADALGEDEFQRLDDAGVIDNLIYDQDVEGRPFALCQEANGRNIGRTRDGRLVIIDYGDDDE